MRVLKFRFWKNKQLMGFRELNTGGIIDIPWDWDSVDQFTGLLDKTGKEIYEGDIVRCVNDYVGTVVWKEKDACFNVDGYYCQSNDYPTMAFMEGQPFEVIGNVCENPELVG